jgi:hypothetical protein
VNFLDEALDEESKRVKDEFPCPHCNAGLTKKKLERLYVSPAGQRHGQHPASTQARAQLDFLSHRQDQVREKAGCSGLGALQKIDALPLSSRCSMVAFPFADMWEAPRMRDKGITHTHHMFLPRAAQAMGALWERRKRSLMRGFVAFCCSWWSRRSGLSVLNRYRPQVFRR